MRPIGYSDQRDLGTIWLWLACFLFIHHCLALAGFDLKSRLNAASYIYNPSKPPFDKGGFFLCWYTNAEPRIRLKEPAIAGYLYNPPQTPPFEKEGLVVSLSAYLTEGEEYP